MFVFSSRDVDFGMYHQVQNCLIRLAKDFCLPGSFPKMIISAFRENTDIFDLKFDFSAAS